MNIFNLAIKPIECKIEANLLIKFSMIGPAELVLNIFVCYVPVLTALSREDTRVQMGLLHEVAHLNLNLMRVFVHLDQIAQTKANKPTKVVWLVLLPGVLEDVGWRHIDFIKEALVLDLFESFGIEQALRQAVVDQVAEA